MGAPQAVRGEDAEVIKRRYVRKNVEMKKTIYDSPVMRVALRTRRLQTSVPPPDNKHFPSRIHGEFPTSCQCFRFVY
jgi:hypothetical protein